MSPQTTGSALDHLQEVFSDLRIIDTHEHMERTPERRYPGGDLFDILKNTFYLWADLISSGMPPDPWGPEEQDDEKKWSTLRQYLPNVENSAYYRGIMRGLRALYAFDEPILDDSNWRSINEAIGTAYADPLWPERVLQEHVRAECVINDVDGFNMNPALFLPSIKFDYLLRGNSAAGRMFIETIHTSRIETFTDYIQLLEYAVTEFQSRGAIALKTVTPYYRSLRYDPVTEAQARNAFVTEGEGTPEQQRIVEDYAFHFILRIAANRGLPVQIHTGLLAWNTTNVPDCNPTLLNPLFKQYPACRFILFHGGYPYADELGVLVKTFPNVYLDLCWLPWISPVLARKYFDIWLDLIPANKFMWGGDAHRAECVHGHWLQTRDVVAKVLAARVTQNDFPMEVAARIVKNVFRNNAIRLFGLKAKIL